MARPGPHAPVRRNTRAVTVKEVGEAAPPISACIRLLHTHF